METSLDYLRSSIWYVKWGSCLPILNHVIQDIQMIIMNEIEIRKVQVYTGERSLTIVFPKTFSEKLNIGK
jgi:hypothetical protein